MGPEDEDEDEAEDDDAGVSTAIQISIEIVECPAENACETSSSACVMAKSSGIMQCKCKEGYTSNKNNLYVALELREFDSL